MERIYSDGKIITHLKIQRSIRCITPQALFQTVVVSSCLKGLSVLILISIVMMVLVTGVEADIDVDWNDVVTYYKSHSETASYEKAIQKYPEIARKGYDKTDALKILAQYKASGWVLNNPLAYYDTLTYCQNEIQKDPGNPKAYYNKASVLIRMGRYETALETIDNAIQINPEYAHAWDKKGLLLEKMGRKQEAAVAYAKAKTLESK